MHVRFGLANRRFVAVRENPLAAGWALTFAFVLVIAPTVLAQCETAQLESSDYAEHDGFGRDVAISGDRSFVGASGNLDVDSGSAYVFLRKGASWIEEAKLVPSDGDVGDQFGRALAADGDFVVVGALADDDACPEDPSCNSGAAYVFRRVGTSWIEEAKLTAPGVPTLQFFGRDVSISGNTVAIVMSTALQGTPPGVVYVFERTESDWELQAQLIPEGTDDDSFLISVSLSGDLLLIGAWLDNGGAGAAYVFRRSGTEWTQEARLVASNSESHEFGEAVAIQGEFAVVGAPSVAFPDAFRGGAAYVYQYEAGSWSEVAELAASDGRDESNFGRSVAMEDGVVLIGARNAAYRFESVGGVWAETVKLIASDWFDGYNGDDLGRTVAIDGDMALVGGVKNISFGAAYVFNAIDGFDCNANSINDSCDLTAGLSLDCNNNGVLDECDIDDAVSDDCNENSVPDECEIANGTGHDCNDNGTLDLCELVIGLVQDCNGNDIPDGCDIAGGFSVDCNDNLIPDECQTDCNGNGVHDGCDIVDGTSDDCNSDGIPDECEPDVNSNGIPDDCECSVLSPPQAERLPNAEAPNIKNRFLSVTPAQSFFEQAIRVTLIDLPASYDQFNGQMMWVGEPQEVSENGSAVEPVPDFGSFMAARLVCAPFYARWNDVGTVHVYHELVIPGAVFAVQVLNAGCDRSVVENFSAPLELETALWGDTLEHCGTIPCLPPDGVVSILDVTAILGRFASDPNSISKARADLEPATLDLRINITDALAALSAFSGLEYSFAPPEPPCDE